jgi:hypothetical protein
MKQTVETAWRRRRLNVPLITLLYYIQGGRTILHYLSSLSSHQCLSLSFQLEHLNWDPFLAILLYTHVHTHTHTHTRGYSRVCTHMHTHTHSCLWSRMHMHTHIHTHLYLHMHEHAHTHTHTHTHRYSLFVPLSPDFEFYGLQNEILYLSILLYLRSKSLWR